MDRLLPFGDLILKNLMTADLLQRTELGIEVLILGRHPGVTEDVVRELKNLVS